MEEKSKAPWGRLASTVSELSEETGLPLEICASVIVQGFRALMDGGSQEDARRAMIAAAGALPAGPCAEATEKPGKAPCGEKVKQ